MTRRNVIALCVPSYSYFIGALKEINLIRGFYRYTISCVVVFKCFGATFCIISSKFSLCPVFKSELDLGSFSCHGCLLALFHFVFLLIVFLFVNPFIFSFFFSSDSLSHMGLFIVHFQSLMEYITKIICSDKILNCLPHVILPWWIAFFLGYSIRL